MSQEITALTNQVQRRIVYGFFSEKEQRMIPFIMIHNQSRPCKHQVWWTGWNTSLDIIHHNYFLSVQEF